MVDKKESILCKKSSSSKQIVEKNRHVLKEIIEVLIMLGKQNIAIRGHKEEKSNFMAVLQGLAKKNPVLSDHLANAPSNAKYTSPEIQNELLSLCGDQILDMLTTQCKNAGVFAIMADESSDISTKEQLSICVRYIEKNEHNRHKLREDFLGFITCKSIKGQAIAQLILENLQQWGLDVLKLRAQCYDGANNMSGKYNGVQALIRERAPLAHYVHCKSHCLNLALVHSSKLQCVRTMMKTVQDIAFAFQYSAKRLQAFADELANDANTREQLDGRHKLKTLCETRWMSRADALTTFKNAFPVIIHALETLGEDNDDKAREHLIGVLRFEFIIALTTAEHILSALVGLTAILQKADMDLIEATKEARVVVGILNEERGDPLVFEGIFQTAVNIASQFQIDPSIPRQIQRQQHRANYDIADPEQYWRVALYNVFVDHLILEITNRVISNEDRFTAQLLIPTRLPELTNNLVDVIYTCYAEDINLPKELFEYEIRRWTMRWSDGAQKPTTIIDTLDRTQSEAYPSIYSILKILLSMPATPASCERSFSSMKRIKTYLRNTMTENRLASLALLHIHRDMEVDVDKIINKFG
ncbi:52 kDa repressor of the inhibitor of the protein kinase-like [Mercenaria mercenaria]|uniref:52 kDa repressor of the inhibitor of the protein kinase-like n=1 Tax=Mercenaria mercenaria TaxID=6596 RepID=UPI00234E703B|nr:52 kDa repressor of the inhibitor of the protein kinase-like [Mercenaria mercenaria]